MDTDNKYYDSSKLYLDTIIHMIIFDTRNTIDIVDVKFRELVTSTYELLL